MNFKKRVNGSWVDTPHYIHNTSTDTLTTLPAVLYPNDTTATVGLKGDMSQSSIPSPSSPVMPQECGERTANLCGIAEQTFETHSMTITAKGNIVTFEGASTHEMYSSDIVWNTLSFTLPAGTYYINPMAGQVTGAIRRLLDTNGNVIADTTQTVFTLSETTTVHLGFYVYQKPAQTQSYVCMLNTGSTALPYEPYGYKIPISSNSTTTNVYLGEVQTTRQIKKLVLTGGEDENWNITNSSKVLYLAVSAFLKEQSTICYCTHYETVNNVSSADDVNDGECTFNDHLNWLYIKDNNYTSAQGFKNYLAAQYAAGTPVTVWYVLATAETGIVNEPIRKIGTYADEVSSITIPVAAGANTISIGTTLQPSEVNVNYKGWHPVSAVYERESGQWD